MREIQQPPLAFLREQMIYHLAHYMALPHHLRMLIQNNWTLKLILIQTWFYLSVTTRLPDTYAMTFKNSSQVIFDRQTRISQLQMEQVLVYKKGLFVYGYKMMWVLSMSSSWTTVITILICPLIFYPRDLLQRNSFIKWQPRQRNLNWVLILNSHSNMVFWAILKDVSKTSFRPSRASFWWRIS